MDCLFLEKSFSVSRQSSAPKDVMYTADQACIAVRERRLSSPSTSDNDLNEMVTACLNHLANRPDRQVENALVEIKAEINARQQRNRHEAKLAATKKLSHSVHELKELHWTVTPSFIVLLLTMIFAAIAAWPVIREWIPNSLPARKGSSFLLPQSNSAPVTPALPQTSTPAIYAAPNTNRNEK
jgi:hypothetical protein